MTVTPISLHVLSQVGGIPGFSSSTRNGQGLPMSLGLLDAPGRSPSTPGRNDLEVGEIVECSWLLPGEQPSRDSNE